MNIRKSIQTVKNQALHDKVKRARIAHSWKVRFSKLEPRMTRAAFCTKYNFNVFTISRYMNQSVAQVKALGDLNRDNNQQIYLASWEMIETMNTALQKEGV